MGTEGGIERYAGNPEPKLNSDVLRSGERLSKAFTVFEREPERTTSTLKNAASKPPAAVTDRPD